MLISPGIDSSLIYFKKAPVRRYELIRLSIYRHFLKILIFTDIDIEIILKCNKIKKFTEDPKDIVIALEKSTLISVSEDGKKIFRTVPVAPVSNADECTIYVVSNENPRNDFLTKVSHILIDVDKFSYRKIYL